MKFNIFSLKFRIAFIVFVLEAILLTFILIKTLNFIENKAFSDMEHRQDIVMELVKNISTAAFFSEEYEDLQLQIDLIVNNNEINYISIVNLNNVILANSDFTLVGSIQVQDVLKPNRQLKIVTIDNFGDIFIEFSSKDLESRISEARNLGIYIAVSGILIIAVASILFGHLLTRKLGILNLAMRKFQKNEDVDISIKGRDEVSELANQFNLLTREVNRQVNVIKDEKNKLEVRVIERTHELQKLNHELEVLANTDHLTSLNNRAFLDNTLEKQISLFFKDNKHIFSIILIDVDNFKSINDTYGHDIGDAILVNIANILEANVRGTDVVGRWGGEEFIMVCIDTDLINSEKIAEKLREKIEEHQFPDVNRITCSFGVSTSKVTDSLDSVFKRADIGLYNAKNNGRNRVVSILSDRIPLDPTA